MPYKYNKVLVTGGAGFVGSHLVDELLSRGFEVTVLDNLSYGKKDNFVHNTHNTSFTFIEGDIRDKEIVKKAMEDMDVVFHEAALVSVPISVKNPLLTNDINVSGTINLMKTAVDLGVKKFVFASSAAVYTISRHPKKDESENCDPTSPYGVSKLADEKYAKCFYDLYGLKTVGLRYFNIYGPRQSCDLQAQYGGVIVIFLNRLLRNQSPIIYGDGKQTRDFVHVKDIVHANLLAMESQDAAGMHLNVGTGLQVSINMVAEILKERLGKEDLKNTYEDARVGDSKHGYADIAKAEKILGFKPQYSFERGITDLVNWYTAIRQNNLN
ncbi:MAG: SDR family oxidoreductase [Candidatus Bathyarchaeia archaeon]|jgi:UDP-glucose 4-epimerase